MNCMRKKALILDLILFTLFAAGTFWYSASWLSMQKNMEAVAACGNSLKCLNPIVSRIITSDSLDTEMRRLQIVFDKVPSFRGECSGFMLLFAQQIYKLHPDFGHLDITPTIATCNYGFLQQYPQSLILATHDTSAAVRLCALVKEKVGGEVPGAEAECFRGIGRGLPFIDPSHTDTQEDMAAFALAQCNALAPNEYDRGTCVSGLFNALGRGGTPEVPTPPHDTNDPMRLCKEQRDAYAKDRCFGNYKAVVISAINLDDIPQAEADIQRLYGAVATSSLAKAFWTIGYERAREKLVSGETFEETVAACSSLDAVWIPYCIQGVSVGLAKHGTPYAQHYMLASFCKKAREMLLGLAPTDCPSPQALGYLQGFYSPQHFASAYDFMKAQLGELADKSKFEGVGY